MSKQSDAKAHHGYTEKPIPETCSNCRHMASEKKYPAWIEKAMSRGWEKDGYGDPFSIETHGIDKNIRCLEGGFAVKKTATCRFFHMKEQA